MRALYKYPGDYQIDGEGYQFCTIPMDQVEKHLAEGWCKTMGEAKNADHPPTREELEIHANKLGIKFDGRTTDKKLASLIADLEPKSNG